jgi:hypothetical protein
LHFSKEHYAKGRENSRSLVGESLGDGAEGISSSVSNFETKRASIDLEATVVGFCGLAIEGQSFKGFAGAECLLTIG